MPLTHAQDRALAVAALGGEPAAIDALTKRTGCIPRYLAVRNRRRGGVFSADDLTDLTQETIVIAWNKLGEYRGEASLETWWCSIAGGVFMNAFRAHIRRRTQALDGAPEPAAATPAQPGTYEHVHRCLERMAGREAEVVRARTFEEVEFEELAQRTGLSISGLKSVYYRALRKLETCLAPYLRSDS